MATPAGAEVNSNRRATGDTDRTDGGIIYL
jgi:hypothetical protein